VDQSEDDAEPYLADLTGIPLDDLDGCGDSVLVNSLRRVVAEIQDDEVVAAGFQSAI